MAWRGRQQLRERGHDHQHQHRQPDDVDLTASGDSLRSWAPAQGSLALVGDGVAARRRQRGQAGRDQPR
ncbi:hypothetical protein A3649_05835 [Mycobacterium ulcerans]|nr:hypothetical protein A3649_05835 [Mycobacterium ulcerans]